MSNKPYAHKRTLLQESNLRLNKEIARQPAWTGAVIEGRGKHLAGRVVAIWPGPTGEWV